MPAVRVLLPRSLRLYWAAAGEVRVQADTVAGALDALAREGEPGLRARIVDEQGRLREFVHVFLNQTAVHGRDLASVELREGDTLHILPSVAGGRR